MKTFNHEYLQGVLNRITAANPAPDGITAADLGAEMSSLIEKLDEAVAKDIRTGVAPLDIADDLAELLATMDQARASMTTSVAAQLDTEHVMMLKRKTSGMH